MKRIELNKEQIDKLKNMLLEYETYKQFSRSKDAYIFTKTIGVKICPYCNINYTMTIDARAKHILRPDIDHFFCKTEYPQFELCLYNLIPSCPQCNERLKRDIDFGKIPHLHPYFHDFDSIMSFRINLKESADYFDKDNLEITFVPKDSCLNKRLIKKAENNIGTFKLKERYQVHTDQVVDLLKKAKYYSDVKREEIGKLLFGETNSLKGLLTIVSLKRILFPEKECDINQVSLGKMKKDIINQYCLS